MVVFNQYVKLHLTFVLQTQLFSYGMIVYESWKLYEKYYQLLKRTNASSVNAELSVLRY